MEARISLPISHPTFECARDALGMVVWQAVGHNQKTVVELFCLEEGMGEAKKVVPVSGHDNSALSDREAELLFVREAPAVDLMDGDDIQAETSTDLGYRRVQVLVEEEAQLFEDRSLPEVT
jgi:hypothetical protein